MSPDFQRHLQIGRQFFAVSNFQNAAREFEAALEIEPDDNGARLMLARCYLELKRPKDARREVEAALQNDPSDADAHFLVSTLAHNAGRALPAIERALELRPDAVHLHLQLSAVHLRSANPLCNGWRVLGVNRRAALVKAENAARTGLKLAPDNAQAHRLVALVLLEQNREEEARQHVLNALSLHPENPRAHVLLSLLHNRQNDGAGAEKALREALRLDPDNRGLQRDLQLHRVGEHLFGWMGDPDQSFLADNPNSAIFKLFNATFGKLPALWRLPALIAAQTAAMAALVTIPSQWIKAGALQSAVLFGLLFVFCFLFFQMNYAARPYLARVPRKFLPAQLKTWGKPDSL